MRAEQHRLEAGDRRVARREVRDGLQADDALDRRGGDEAAHTRPGSRVVVHVDDVDVPRALQRAGELEHRLGVSASRRVDLDRDHELAIAELALQHRLVLGLGRRDDELALADDEPGARAALLVDGAPDRRDPDGRRPAAPADDARAELPRVRCELGEVLGRRVREDHALARQGREPDVRERGEGLAAVRHALDRAERGLEAGSVIRPDRGDLEPGQCARGLLGGDTAERVCVLVEREERDDGERGDPAHRRDRAEELVELEERLDHEEVDAAALQQLRLLGEDRSRSLTGPPSGPIEPAMKTSDPDTSRASRASFTAVSLMTVTSSSR